MPWKERSIVEERMRFVLRLKQPRCLAPDRIGATLSAQQSSSLPLGADQHQHVLGRAIGSGLAVLRNRALADGLTSSSQGLLDSAEYHDSQRNSGSDSSSCASNEISQAIDSREF